MSLSLATDPWIPVQAGHRRLEVSLSDALIGAHGYVGLTTERPLEVPPVLRLLVALLLDVFGPPRTPDEWMDRWDAGAFDEARISAYLDEWRDRLDLFHPTAPFGQVADHATAKGESKSAALLVPTQPSGNNVPLFAARTEAHSFDLTPAEAARGLLVTHAWDTAAIKSGAVGDPRASAGKTTGNPTGPLGQLGVVVPVGRTLFETLMLNTPIIPAGLPPGDRPAWRAEPSTAAWSERAAFGPMDLLTWQSRRIRLLPETGPSGVVVRRVVVSAGDRLLALPRDIEPHTMWRTDPKPKAGAPPHRPVRHQPGRSLWRGLSALTALTPTADNLSTSLLLGQIATVREAVGTAYPLQVLAVGVMYGNQSAVVEDVVVDQIPLPVLSLFEDSQVRFLVLAVVDEAEALRRAANGLWEDLREAARADSVAWDRGQRLGDLLTFTLSPTVERLLAGIQREPERVDEARDAWRSAARAAVFEIAETALAAAPPRTFAGRLTDSEKGFRVCAATAEAKFRRKVADVLGAARPKENAHV